MPPSGVIRSPLECLGQASAVAERPLRWQALRARRGCWDASAPPQHDGKGVAQGISRIPYYAAAHDYVIVTKGSDFYHLSLLRGQPPKTVRLRVGNVSTSTVAALLKKHELVLRHFVEDPDAAVLVLA
jgi:predicted nuclease of predicted toxin-antitoxin system